jgi:hypothetical protein
LSNARPTLMKGLLVLVGALLPATLAGQAICAAPHSAPSLRPSGSLETIEPLTGWVQVAAFRQQATEFFNSQGDVRNLLADGKITTSSVFISSAFGITEGLEVWGQVPVHNLQSSSTAGGSTSLGFGDPRIALRIGGDLFGIKKVPVLLRAGLKVSGQSFPVDATILPLTEGQTDWEMGLETGYYFAGSFPIQVIATGGYRWRGLRSETGRKPGNERFTYLGIGGPRNGWRWGLAFEGLWGAAPVDNGVLLPGASRKLLQIDPSVAFQIGGKEVEFSFRFPVSGRNLATGNSLTIGIFMPWALS